VALVFKSCGGLELLKAIEEVLHGRSYLTPRLRAEDRAEANARARQFSMELTERQRGFVQLFTEGHSLKEIAEALNVCEKTVEFLRLNASPATRLISGASLLPLLINRQSGHCGLNVGWQ
jgi:DNA-binding NarL/FixJ family response regulator